MIFKRLHTTEEITGLIDWLNASVPFTVLDLETTGLDQWKSTIVDIQLSLSHDKVAIFSGSHVSLLKALNIPLVGHNLKFDLKMLYRNDVDLTHLQWRDTMIQAHLLDENRPSHSLDSLVQEIWGDKYKDTFWTKYDSYEEAPEEERLEYACKDVAYTHQLYLRQLKDIQTQALPSTLITHVHELARTLLCTELDGLLVDRDYLIALGHRLTKETHGLRQDMLELTMHETDDIELDMWHKKMATYKTDRGKIGVKRPMFSFDSSRQLATLLYDKLRLPVQKNDKTKSVSTDEASLHKLEGLHPLIPLLLSYREKQKLLNTYIEGTLDRLHEDGRIYPEFNVIGTATGRISHSNPNLGQLPKEGGIRGMYVPDPGHVFISADYSSLEVVLEAHLTQDPNLLKIVREGLSKHDMTAEKLGIERSLAKSVNFLLQYWGSHYKLAKVLHVTPEEAKPIWEAYWKVYSGPKKMKKQIDYWVDKGIPIVNVYGRKRRFEAKEDRYPWDGDYRQAYNAAIQGLGSDITSEGFYLIDKWLRVRHYGKGILTVHDEIIIQVLEAHAVEAEAKLKEIMVGVGQRLQLTVPLSVETSGPMKRWED